ncbi:MAG: DNA polymerase III subunit delta [Rikenellaceae bacterium]|jgi:DNA polymerase-3 subunit delta|nr:DNA polymerase III subunit delta [Rikenellaceae bacterium]
MAKSTVRFKDSVAAFEQIRGDIAARRFAPVYLLMGEEGYFIDEVAERLAEDVLSEAEAAFNRIIVYGRDSEVGAIINLARQMPMMGAYQLVIVREAQQLAKIEELSLYTANPSPTTILVVCHKGKNIDKRSQLYKHAVAKGAVLEAVKPYDNEIRQWLGDFIGRRGLKADVKAIEMLTEHLGSDIQKIANELQKLVLSLPAGVKTVTPEDVERNTGFSKDFNNFELNKAVATRSEARALMIADHFARNPKEHPLIVTIITLFGQLKQIFIVNYYLWLAQRKGQPMPSDSDLARVLSISPFFVGDVKQAAKNYPNKITFKILGLIREYDAKSKGMNNGGMSDGELLRELLLKIFAIR